MTVQSAMDRIIVPRDINHLEIGFGAHVIGKMRTLEERMEEKKVISRIQSLSMRTAQHARR
jgi:hypothetical protein